MNRRLTVLPVEGLSFGIVNVAMMGIKVHQLITLSCKGLESRLTKIFLLEQVVS